jgi:hypothetical protein
MGMRPRPAPCVTMSRALAMGPGLGSVMAGHSETPSDMVVDRANVLHERIHARRADEVISLGLWLFGQRLRQARRGGHHRSRVIDGRVDLGQVADDRRVLQQPIDIQLSPASNTPKVSASNIADSSCVRVPQTLSW